MSGGPVVRAAAARPPEAPAGEGWHGTRDRELGPVVEAKIRTARQRLRDRLDAGGSGSSIVASYTSAVDDVVRSLYRAAADPRRARSGTGRKAIALLAQGGYGRRELHPGSDLDVVFLHSGRPGPFLGEVVARFLGSLRGIRADHSVRTVRDCVRLARSDPRVRTALLESRLVCGDRALYREFRSTMKEKVFRRGVGRFFAEKLAEHERRRAGFGDPSRAIEPHVKEGFGGLRDLHLALWVARSRWEVRSLPAAARKARLSEGETAPLLAAVDFLQRVRTALHLASGSCHDRLTLDLQRPVARLLGYRHDARDETAAEAGLFMSDFRRHATSAAHLSAKVVERALASARSRHARSSGAARKRRP